MFSREISWVIVYAVWYFAGPSSLSSLSLGMLCSERGWSWRKECELKWMAIFYLVFSTPLISSSFYIHAYRHKYTYCDYSDTQDDYMEFSSKNNHFKYEKNSIHMARWIYQRLAFLGKLKMKKIYCQLFDYLWKWNVDVVRSFHWESFAVAVFASRVCLFHNIHYSPCPHVSVHISGTSPAGLSHTLRWM